VREQFISTNLIILDFTQHVFQPAANQLTLHGQQHLHHLRQQASYRTAKRLVTVWCWMQEICSESFESDLLTTDYIYVRSKADGRASLIQRTAPETKKTKSK